MLHNIIEVETISRAHSQRFADKSECPVTISFDFGNAFPSLSVAFAESSEPSTMFTPVSLSTVSRSGSERTQPYSARIVQADTVSAERSVACCMPERV